MGFDQTDWLIGAERTLTASHGMKEKLSPSALARLGVGGALQALLDTGCLALSQPLLRVVVTAAAPGLDVGPRGPLSGHGASLARSQCL